MNCPCCCELQATGHGISSSQWADGNEVTDSKWHRSQTRKFLKASGSCCFSGIGRIQRWVKKLVEHKYFQQGILLAILINTLSMGIEYHNQVRKFYNNHLTMIHWDINSIGFTLLSSQPEELTVIVEISNYVFSAVFAVEMLLKIIAEGPFGYISNGFNVFDGVVVVLR